MGLIKMSRGTIKKVAGPLVIAEGMRDASMFDVVRVSEQRLIGEIIEIHGDEASIQVYEETSGLGPENRWKARARPFPWNWAPASIGSIFGRYPAPFGRDYEGFREQPAAGCGGSLFGQREKMEICPFFKGRKPG